jgi:general transcription factor 3C polypeptide 5 (transcription factor C subunit 1)
MVNSRNFVHNKRHLASYLYKANKLQIIYSTDPEECIPLYLRFQDPACPPILSQNATTENILLKITVPKRTGRRRKKGSQEPFTDRGGPVSPTARDVKGSQSSQNLPLPDEPIPSLWENDLPPEPENCSHSRLDTNLWKRLRDNVGKYECEAVAEIQQTHRFRGQ